MKGGKQNICVYNDEFACHATDTAIIMTCQLKDVIKKRNTSENEMRNTNDNIY